MAEKAYSVEILDDSTQVVKWVLTNGDTAKPYEGSNFADLSVSMEGTWGSASVDFEGTNGTSYVALTDPFGNAVSATDDDVFQVVENTRFRKPTISGGSASSVTVYLLMRRNRHP